MYLRTIWLYFCILASNFLPIEISCLPLASSLAPTLLIGAVEKMYEPAEGAHLSLPPLHILDQSSGVELRSTHESVMEQTPCPIFPNH